MAAWTLARVVRSAIVVTTALGATSVAVLTSLGYASLARPAPLILRVGPVAGMGYASYAEKLLSRAVIVDPANPTKASLPAAPARAAIAAALEGLSRAPMLARGLRTIGLAYGLRNNVPAADRMMVLSGRLSRRDQPTELWLINRAYRLKRYEEAAAHFDALLRVSTTARDLIFKATVPLMGERRLFAAISRRMVDRPSWRPAFLQAVGASAPIPVALATLQQQQRFGAAPTAEESEPLFERAPTSNDVAFMRAAWFGFLPQGTPRPTVFNGGFEPSAATKPFNWELSSEDNVIVQRLRRDDGRGYAARAELYTSSLTILARQLMALPPGRYQLSADGMAEAGASDAIQWSVRCNDAAQPLVTMNLRTPQEGRWNRQVTAFTVPATCNGAWLILATETTSETTQRAVWVDNVSITPLR